MPYRVEKLFESLVDNTPELRLFIYSPASQAIDFAAAAFPSLRPNPKVIDDTPLMQYGIPANITQNSEGISGAMLAVTLLLLGMGAGICITAMRSSHIRLDSRSPAVGEIPTRA